MTEILFSAKVRDRAEKIVDQMHAQNEHSRRIDIFENSPWWVSTDENHLRVFDRIIRYGRTYFIGMKK